MCSIACSNQPSRIFKQIGKSLNVATSTLSPMFQHQRHYAETTPMPQHLKNVPDQSGVPFNNMVRYNFHKARLLIENNMMQSYQEDRERLGRKIKIFMTYLETVDSIVEFTLPTLRETGEVEVLSGFKATHKEFIKPVLCGIRFSLDMNLDKALALASTMTFTCANATIPHGGSSAGLAIDPKSFSEFELERIVRQYTNLMTKRGCFGPGVDVPAPAIGTGKREMAWIVDAYSATFGRRYVHGSLLACALEKPFTIGGLKIYKQSQGMGVALSLQQFATNEKFMETLELKTGLDGKTFIMHGFGTVGFHAAMFATRAGAKCIGVREVEGAIMNKNGIDPEALKKFKTESRTILGFPGAEDYKGPNVIHEACDVLIFTSKERRLDKDAVDVKAKIIVEGSAGAVTPSADKILLAKGALVLPDILTSSGGVVIAYAEWCKNVDMSYHGFTDKYRRLRTLDCLGSVEGSLHRQGIDVKITASAELLRRIGGAPREELLRSTVEYAIETATSATIDIAVEYELGLDIRTAAYINAIMYIIKNFHGSTLMGNIW